MASALLCAVTVSAAIFERCVQQSDGVCYNEDTCEFDEQGACVGHCNRNFAYGIGDCKPNGIYCTEGTTGVFHVYEGSCAGQNCDCILPSTPRILTGQASCS